MSPEAVSGRYARPAVSIVLMLDRLVGQRKADLPQPGGNRVGVEHVVSSKQASTTWLWPGARNRWFF
eukprot:4278858-Prymnesium_polylepis.1